MSRQPTDKRFAFLDSIRDLPSLPQVLVGISRVASDPNSGATELADVILKDQALTMKVLRISNSAQYAVCPQRITTISRAVVMLGFESVRAIALGLGAYNLLSSLERGGKLHENFWKNSVAVAVTCQVLAPLLEIKTVEEAFVGGLLHDVGKLVLTAFGPEQAVEVYGQGIEGPALLRLEQQVYGVDHTEVAAELARRWELPEILQTALQCHHRSFSRVPDDNGERLAFLVGVAKTLSLPLWNEGVDLRALASSVARLLRKPVGTVLKEIRGLPAKIEEYANFFEIKLDDLKQYTLWLEEEHRRLFEEVEQREGGRRAEERRQAELATMRDIHGLILEGADPAVVGRRVLRGAREAAGSRRSVAALVSIERNELYAVWGDGDVTPDFLAAFRFPLDDPGVLIGVIRNAEPVNVFDAALPYFARLLGPREAGVLKVPSFAAFPLHQPGGVAGLLYADRDERDEPFSDEEAETLASLADMLSLSLRSGDGQSAAS